MTKEHPRKKVTVACTNCKKTKTKCDGNDPCAKCVNKKLSCLYVAPVKNRGPTPKLKDSCQERENLRKKGQFQRIQPKPLLNVEVNTIASIATSNAERNSHEANFNAMNNFLQSPGIALPGIIKPTGQTSSTTLRMEQNTNDTNRFQQYEVESNENFYLTSVTTCSPLVDPPIEPSHFFNAPSNIEFSSSSLPLPYISSSSLPYTLPSSGTSPLIMFNKNKRANELTFPEELFFSNYDNLISDDIYSLQAETYSGIDSNSTVNMNTVLVPMNVAIANINTYADIYNVAYANVGAKMSDASLVNAGSTDVNVIPKAYGSINSNIPANAIFWISGDPSDEH
ncbi:12541_t:CDS:2 [Acaulospora morrowiae]|uniref:12541_t:CDS:1 n=1 Tax=Acaulospora morrowiae TaxID=94023 RepID=A0A9N8ZP17_9GLOM|nr:12541_t:CDS:2 [Acaulospora morrowiae]